MEGNTWTAIPEILRGQDFKHRLSTRLYPTNSDCQNGFSLAFNACNMTIMIRTLSRDLKKYIPKITGCLRFVGYFVYIVCGHSETRTPDLYCITVASFLS